MECPSFSCTCANCICDSVRIRLFKTTLILCGINFQVGNFVNQELGMLNGAGHTLNHYKAFIAHRQDLLHKGGQTISQDPE